MFAPPLFLAAETKIHRTLTCSGAGRRLKPRLHSPSPRGLPVFGDVIPFHFGKEHQPRLRSYCPYADWSVAPLHTNGGGL